MGDRKDKYFGRKNKPKSSPIARKHHSLLCKPSDDQIKNMPDILPPNRTGKPWEIVEPTKTEPSGSQQVSPQDFRINKMNSNTPTSEAAGFSKCYVLFPDANIEICHSVSPISDPKGNAPQYSDHCFRLKAPIGGHLKYKSERHLAASTSSDNQPSASMYELAIGQPKNLDNKVPEGYRITKMTASFVDKNEKKHLLATVFNEPTNMIPNPRIAMPPNPRIAMPNPQISMPLNQQALIPTYSTLPDNEDTD